MKLRYGVLLFVLVILVSAQTVSAIPELPMIMSGKVYIDDEIAPEGTKLIAKSGKTIIADVTIAQDGSYSLLLQDMQKGDKARFYVNGLKSDPEVFYESSSYEEIDIRAKTPPYALYAGGAVLAAGGIAGIIWKKKKSPKKQ